MCEISASHVGDNMAEFLRMHFIEENPEVVGAPALSRYVEVAPDTRHAAEFVRVLGESQPQDF